VRWQKNVIEAQDGLIGEELAKKHHPDLIIMDIIMPRQDGITTIRKLKENSQTKDIPIIIITGKAGVSMKIFSKILLATFLTQSFLFSQTFKDAEKLYKEAKYEEAIQILEKLYSKEKTKQVKELLLKTLTERGMELSMEGDYSGATVVFARAKELNPDDTLIQELFQTSFELSKLEKKEKAQKPAQKEVPQKFLNQQKQLLAKLEELTETLKSSRKKISATERKLKKIEEETKISRERILDELSKTTSKISEQNQKTGREIVSAIVRKSEETKKSVYIAFLLGVATFLIILFLIFYSAKKFVTKKIIPMQVERKTAQKILLPPHEDRINKFEGIEIIEAELSTDEEKEKNVAENLLKPFIDDADPEIKKKAINTLFKYNPVSASDIITKMSSSKDMVDKILVCQLLDLLPVDRGISIIEKYIKTQDPELKRNVLKAIRLLVNRNITEVQKEKIRKLLKTTEEDEWIIT